MYQSWFDPEDASSRSQTIPTSMRQFIQRHFAEVGSKVSKAFEQKHVKNNVSERKHITFLLNKAGTLGSKVCSERLARAQRAIDERGRLIEGAKLSAAARKRSIERELRMVNEIRWLCDMLSEGSGAYSSGKRQLNFQSKLDNFRGANPHIPESTAKKVLKAVEKDAEKRREKPRPPNSSDGRQWGKYITNHCGWPQVYAGGGTPNGARGNPWSPYTPVKPRQRFNKKVVCYHCGEVGHPARLCPAAAAGRPPARGSFFDNRRNGGRGRGGRGRGRGGGRGRGRGGRGTAGVHITPAPRPNANPPP